MKIHYIYQWRIKDKNQFSYLYFKNRTITNALYDNDIKKLIVNFGETNNKGVCGAIRKMSNKEIEKEAVKVKGTSLQFKHSKKTDTSTTGKTININGIEQNTIKRQSRIEDIDR